MKIKYSAITEKSKALEAVKQNGYALRYVKDQTEAICLEAVKNDGDALQYVLELETFRSVATKLDIQVEV